MDYTPEELRNLAYYRDINKVFWVIAHDMGPFKQYEKIPCIFVESCPGVMKILKFDYEIEFDEFQYTAWRRLIGQIYGIRVDVLLIHNGTLYKLDGTTVDFANLRRSSVLVDKKYLARMSKL